MLCRRLRVKYDRFLEISILTKNRFVKVSPLKITMFIDLVIQVIIQTNWQTTFARQTGRFAYFYGFGDNVPFTK